MSKETSIQALEVQAISFADDMVDVERICKEFAEVPSADDKEGDALCRSRANEARTKRLEISGRWGDAKKKINFYKKEGDRIVGDISEKLMHVENNHRDEYRRVENKKKAEKEAREKAESARIAALRQKLMDIQNAAFVQFGTPLDAVEQKLSALESLEVTKEEYQELYGECCLARDNGIATLKQIIVSEKERIEKERIAAEEAARIAEEQRIERERIAAEKAEQERIRAEQEAKLQADREAFEREKREREEKERVEREEREAVERAEKAAREAEESKKRAEEQARIDAENKRIAEERAAIEAEKAEQRRIAEEKERERIAEEKRQADAELQDRNRHKIIDELHAAATSEDVDDWFIQIADAIIAGKIPHVQYIG